MNRAKRKLAAALKKTDDLPESWFGAEEASLEDLPSVRRSRRIRKNIFIEKETVEVLEAFCEKHEVPFTDVANDILTKYVDAQKKKKVG